jgi:TrbL/VirB6 plasmid conjugal transfer protein
LSIMFVYVLLTSYTIIFPAIASGTNAIGNAIGGGIAKLPTEQSFAKAVLTSFGSMTFTPTCNGLDCLSKGFMALVGTAMAWIAVVVLGIATLLVELWTTWGFAIAYAVGWVTIPFMLYERLHFLFDGWLKFFFGMGVYAILAKANLALVYLAIQKMLKSGTGAGGEPLLTYQVGGLAEVAGLLVFVTVGIFSLFSTSRFAQSIVGGAGGGGIAGMVQSAAKAGATAASGGAGAAAGASKK